ncbi:MAG: arylsulfatase [Pseudomonadota bacterium]|nr:arylsulfatase [Pseudomonadota bacterium]
MNNALRLCTVALAACSTGTVIAGDQAPTARRPNIVLIVGDDFGYTDIGAYGSEVRTPNLDALAASGAQLSNYHTAPLCSPSRAMLMTGVDSHVAGIGNLPETTPIRDQGKPGYLGRLDDRVVTLATRLNEGGYRTYMTGKWHLGMEERAMPHRRGFERSFHLEASGADNWEKRSYLPIYDDAPWFEDGKPVNLPDDFYSSRFLVDKLSEYIDSGANDPRPFFAYLAFQAIHIPVQAPRSYVEKYNGVYDQGWTPIRAARHQRAIELGLIPADTALRPLPSNMRNWDALPQETRDRLAMNMQVNSGMIEAMDFHLGRFIDHLKATNQYDNTVFVFVSDNGPEPNDPLDTPGVEQWLDWVGYSRDLKTLGEKGTYAYIGPEFATAAASPYADFKFYASEGGLRVPMIMAGAAVPKAGKVDALAFASDVAPTLLELAGVALVNSPDTIAMTGRSIMPALRAPDTRLYAEDEAVGIETAGNAALFLGDYKLTRNLPPYGDGQWHLFDIVSDPGEANDLAQQMPEQFQRLLAAYGDWSQRVGVIEVPEGYSSVRQLSINHFHKLAKRHGWIVGVLIAAGIALLIWRRRRHRA